MEVGLAAVGVVPPPQLPGAGQGLLLLAQLVAGEVGQELLLEALVEDHLAGGAKPLGKVQYFLEHLPHVPIDAVRCDCLLSLLQELPV